MKERIRYSASSLLMKLYIDKGCVNGSKKDEGFLGTVLFE